jgi:hypothetical protein
MKCIYDVELSNFGTDLLIHYKFLTSYRYHYHLPRNVPSPIPIINL